MSDEGEKTCPLCAEEMDLTDQQLKPCKCGYEICVWCWHHVMDMAEKDDTEGRCPACRSPYDKEKIVGMAANCERLVAEISMERKKSQKSKTKSSEARKQHLSSVRVIQRNLVYIVGLPHNLGDEELLQHGEYFGQYGKVLKVSMSRTAAGVIQQFPNNTCSVYITYSKEEEAVRCIQSVHGFVLEGKSLKACFGTTKYCHAWLRNVPCSNPDCLYLHEIGSQEDSFTKDEIISAYTRNRVQQITGTANNLQRRAGNVLPPPVDDYCYSSSTSTAKPTVKNASNNIASITKESTANESSGRSVTLPAAASWGMRASIQQPVATSVCSNGPSKQKPDNIGGDLVFSSVVANTTPLSALHGDLVTKPSLNEDSQVTYGKGKLDSLKPLRPPVGMDYRTSTAEKPPTPNGEPTSVSSSSQASSPQLSRCNDKGHIPPFVMNSLDNTGSSCVSGPEKEGNVSTDGKMLNLCSDMSAMSIDRNVTNEHSGVSRSSSSLPDHGVIRSPRNQALQHYFADQTRELLTLPGSGKPATSTNEVFVSRKQFDWRTDPQTRASMDASPQEEEDVLSFDSQRLKDPEVVCHSTYLSNSVNSLHFSNHSRSHSFQHSEALAASNLNADTQFVDGKVLDSSPLHSSGMSSILNGHAEKLAKSSGSDRTLENGFLLSNEGKMKPGVRLRGDSDINAATDTGENSIISNILSMDFDTWDDPLDLPQNLAKLLGETDKEPSSVNVSSSWKGHNNGQSRFSFARQEETRNQAFDFERSFNAFSQFPPTGHSFSQEFAETKAPFNKLGIRNGFYPSSFEESDNFSSNPSVFSSNKFSAASRSQISAPPGFSVPSRAPPPGFSTHERVDHSFDTMSGNHLLDSSSLLRNTYQTQPAGNIGSTGDIEFMDPAILAVGKGRLHSGHNNPGLDMRANFPTQLNAFENEARLQLMMERSLSSHQNLRYSNMGNNFSSLNDSYGISPRLMDQPQVNNLSPLAQLSIQQSRNSLISNGHWDGWNEVQGGHSLGMAELLRNDRLGSFNKFYTGYEDSKFRVPSSGDLYNRTFGM